MTLLLTRHGQTEENKQHILQGWLPGHLSGLGKEQAQELALKLKNRVIDAAYCSDLQRAVDTAKIALQYHPNVSIIEDELLRERHLGKYQGTVLSKERHAAFGKEFTHKRIPGGETSEEVLERVTKFYEKIKEQDKTILIIGHFGSIALLYGYLQGKGIEESMDTKIKNCELLEYSTEHQ